MNRRSATALSGLMSSVLHWKKAFHCGEKRMASLDVYLTARHLVLNTRSSWEASELSSVNSKFGRVSVSIRYVLPCVDEAERSIDEDDSRQHFRIGIQDMESLFRGKTQAFSMRSLHTSFPCASHIFMLDVQLCLNDL